MHSPTKFEASNKPTNLKRAAAASSSPWPNKLSSAPSLSQRTLWRNPPSMALLQGPAPRFPLSLGPLRVALPMVKIVLFLSSFWITLNKRKIESRATSISIRCEQGAKQNNGLDVWLGRLAMVGFATAITVEISTGKGLLENFGFTTPLPTLALAVTALVGVLAAFFIFQSASRE
ncbi:Stress enhanced protein 1, chloroplastic [Ananas comosus]|uniref:Stress enhanced protein 1, chloroplastic n=1 Tax=Ananas comosus TaxID=4615 RepID=A0A199VWF0_ANACO|nr:Stress enhanced protein 1, chloroplastic [Ananas comosus]